MALKSQVVHVSVDKATERQLKDLAKREDLPVSAVIRRAIVSHLASQSTEQAA